MMQQPNDSQRTDQATAGQTPVEQEANAAAAGSSEPAAQAEAVDAQIIDEEAEADSDVVREAEAVLEQADAEPTADQLVEAAQAEAKEWQDKYMRLHAEWDTYRRRMNEQRAAEKLRATEKLVENLIPVIDDFERTIDFAAKNGEAGLLDGVVAVRAKLVDALVKDGVEVIDPAGQPYNALEAQAVAMVPNADVPDETVQDVYQKGYKMGIKVLRPAMVTVTTGGPKRQAEEAAE